MEVGEIKARKKYLKESILERVRHFESATGVKINYVTILHEDRDYEKPLTLEMEVVIDEW